MTTGLPLRIRVAGALLVYVLPPRPAPKPLRGCGADDIRVRYFMRPERVVGVRISRHYPCSDIRSLPAGEPHVRRPVNL